MKDYLDRFKNEGGFISLKTSILTASALVVATSIGVTAAIGLSAPALVGEYNIEEESGFCVTAVWADNSKIVDKRGFCKTEDEVTPEIPEEPEVPIETEAPKDETPEVIARPAMVTTWDTSLDSKCHDIALPISGNVDTVIDWGDGSEVETVVSDTPSHTFTGEQGLKEIRIEGSFDSWGSKAWEDANCIISVNSWEETGTTNLAYGFENADNFNHIQEIPSTTDDMVLIFSKIDKNFTIGVDGYLDTKNVTNMGGLFHTTPRFNNPIDFDTSKVDNMSWMFYLAEDFDHPVEFDTRNVADMDSFFYGAESFNHPINFTSPNVKLVRNMFRDAISFNSPIKLDTSKVTSMHAMFFGASIFNQEVDFDTSEVTEMVSVFNSAKEFNQDLSEWKVGKVTDYRYFKDNASDWVLPKPKWVV